MAQNCRITPKRMLLLTGRIDSLVRSYAKKGFSPIVMSRDPAGIFSDCIHLQDGFSLDLVNPFGIDAPQWMDESLDRYGAHVSGLAFACRNPDSLYRLFRMSGIGCKPVAFESDSAVRTFALDFCHPLDVVFTEMDTVRLPDSLTVQRNGVYRLDWIILSAGSKMKAVFRRIFELTDAWAQHQGCCDYWRTGPSDDFTFFRFDLAPPPEAAHDPNWLSIQPDNFYWAY